MLLAVPTTSQKHPSSCSKAEKPEVMQSYSLPVSSRFSKREFSPQPSAPGKVLESPQPMQTCRKRSHEQSEVLNPGDSSIIQKPDDKSDMETKTQSSKLEQALQQRRSASGAKLLPLSYRNDPMRVASTYKREHVGPESCNSDYKKITSKTSRLANIDLEAFLKDDRVWNRLRPEQQRGLIKRSGLEFVTNITQLPDGRWPNVWNLAQDNEHIALDEVVEKYQRNLKAGKLDPEWRANAKSAAVKRARGDFLRQDTLLEEEQEDESESSDDESSEDAEDDKGLDNPEDDLDMGMEGAEVKGNGISKKIPRKLSIKIYED
ncbi:hypothetical protein FKW77_002161 [Venturia effusa]|uniref:ASX DEUBAD domain-containing protein n=1 Tax=Venturia effusa TaxID=50376 RepID=A0A517LMB3_9PEZI|nr:hypothetical protein FKW77_002161 [Venturia effusa]